MAKASVLRLSFSRWEVLGKEFGLAGIKCSIFFSRPPKVTLAFRFLEASSPFEEYNPCTRMQEKNEPARKFFRVGHSYFGTRRFVLDAAGVSVRTLAIRFRPPLVVNRL
jgi:hypothetical protein